MTAAICRCRERHDGPADTASGTTGIASDTGDGTSDII
jgi:hypothetical protein